VITYALPLTGSTALYLVYLNLGKVVLGYILGAEQVGLFAFVFNINERVIGMASAIPAALLPSLVSVRVRGGTPAVRALEILAFKWTGVIASLVAAGMFVFAREIVWVFGGKEYSGATALLQIVAFQSLFRLSSQTVNTVLLMCERTIDGFLVNLAKVGLEFGLYFLLVPTFAIRGALVAHVIGYLVALVLTTLIACRLLYVSARGYFALIFRLTILLVAMNVVEIFVSNIVPVAAIVVAIKSLYILPMLLAGWRWLGLASPQELSRIAKRLLALYSPLFRYSHGS
jgi:O-antigen/teichoic acid export membrane protein